MKRGFKQVPDMESLSQRLKSCLQEGDPIPADFSKLFDCNLFAFDTSLVPEAVQLYERLRVKHEPLRFIAPQFDGAASTCRIACGTACACSSALIWAPKQ